MRVLLLLLLGSLLHGKEHRPDDNSCRHPCHHEAALCADKCESARCIMECIRVHRDCVEACERASIFTPIHSLQKLTAAQLDNVHTIGTKR